MQRALIWLIGVGLLAVGAILIWSDRGCLGCGAMLAGGAALGLSQVSPSLRLDRALCALAGFGLLLAGGFLLYQGHAACGILVTLLAAVPWYFVRDPNDPRAVWRTSFLYSCFAFWTFGAALLFRGHLIEGGLLLAASIVPWYAAETLAGRPLVLTLTLLGETTAWCGAAAALARERHVLAAVLIAFFLVSRQVDDFLLVRKGHELSEGNGPLSWRAYLNLPRDEARRLRVLGQQQ